MANISLKDIQFPGLNNVYKVPEVDNTLTQSGEAADAKKTGDEITSLKQDLTQQLLINDEVPNTVQSYTFSDGSVSQIVHKRSGTTIRTDVFTYGTSSITEVRTLNTGETLTIVTNLETLETSITYAA